MTNFSQLIKRTFLAIAASTLLFSCTDVDKTLGVDFIPTDELSQIKVDVLHPNVYTVALDSMFTTSLGYILVGSDYSPIFGLTEVASAFQVLPFRDTVKFGTDPICDSLILQLTPQKSTGSKTAPQTLRIYELNEGLTDSVYYPGADLSSLIKANPIAQVSNYVDGDTIRVKLDIELGKRLVKATEAEMTIADTVSKSPFFNILKGLCIIADPATGTGNERLNYFTSSATLTLHYRNKEHPKDTTCLYASGLRPTRMISSFKHDYSKGDAGLKMPAGLPITDTATIANAPLAPVVYLQGLYGPTPYVHLTKNLVTKWLEAKNLSKEHVAISRVELVVEMEEFTGFDISKYPSKIAASSAYNPYGEIFGGSWVKFYGWLPSFNNMSLFDGNMNRSLKKYSFNLTYEFSQLVRGTEASWKFFLHPYNTANDDRGTTFVYPHQLDSYSAILRGTTHPTSPIKLIVTYTTPQEK